MGKVTLEIESDDAFTKGISLEVKYETEERGRLLIRIYKPNGSGGLDASTIVIGRRDIDDLHDFITNMGD
jgi:hypothetical protein